MANDLYAGALPVPLASQIAEVEREIALRERCYPRWVASNSMTQKNADKQLLAMRAVLETLREIQRQRLEQ